MPKNLKILIIGSGGREHAVGWKVKQSPRASEIFFAPGNGGTLEIGTNVDISATDIPKLLEFAKKERIDLTLALPDDPLSLGIVNEFEKSGLRIWGPTKEAAELEWSKVRAKSFMQKYDLPTARYATFKDFEEAKAYVEKEKMPIVIKASGLALGKGVVIAENLEQAINTLDQILNQKTMGQAGEEVVVEEFLQGTEISIHAFSDGSNYSIFPPSQDHKRIGEGNTGLNTGGMGTIAPVSLVNKELMMRIENTIVAPTILNMRKENRPFKGILYPGLMLTESGSKILEYNARFGDPETQTYMRLLDTDILDIFEACIDGKLKDSNIQWKKGFACTIILAAAGYPEKYQKEDEIFGLEEASMDKDVVIFHAGTKISNGRLVTNGGRVLGVSVLGKTLEEALKIAYRAVKKINFKGVQYRKDIGQGALLISS